MDKEIIELLKTLAGNAETLVIWYMVLDFSKSIVGWTGAGICLYMLGNGIGKGVKWLNDN